MNTIEGTSEFRGAGKLARMKELLDSANVPEHPLNEKRLQEVVAIWNQHPPEPRQSRKGGWRMLLGEGENQIGNSGGRGLQSFGAIFRQEP